MDCIALAHTHRLPHGLSIAFSPENRHSEKVSPTRTHKLSAYAAKKLLGEALRWYKRKF